MKYKLITLILLFVFLFILNPLDLMANDNSENKVCFYQKNCQGELEYICIDSDGVNPYGTTCPPPCRNPEE